MKGLKVIPVFGVLMLFSYLGLLFVEANREEVVISFGASQSPPMPLGFVVLTAILIGMVCCGFLCAVELLVLYVQNKRLRRKVDYLTSQASSYNSTPSYKTPDSDSEETDKILAASTSGRPT